MTDREPVLVLGQEEDPVADAAEMQQLADAYDNASRWTVVLPPLLYDAAVGLGLDMTGYSRLGSLT